MRAFVPLVAMIGLTLALACGTDDGRRVLIVGIDGASPEVIDPLIAAGGLPTLGTLRAGGLDFTWSDGDGRSRLYLARERRVHALRNLASDAGRSVVVVNWWNTFPPDRVRGAIVSDHALPGRTRALARETGAAPPQSGPRVWPPEWQARVDELLSAPAAPPATDPLGDPQALPDWVDFADLSRFPAADAALVEVALELERALHPDLLMLLIPGIDRVSHHLWFGLEPQGSLSRRALPADDAAVAGGWRHAAALLRVHRRAAGPAGRALR